MGVASGWQYGSETPPAVMITSSMSSAGGSTHLKSLASGVPGRRLAAYPGWPPGHPGAGFTPQRLPPVPANMAQSLVTIPAGFQQVSSPADQ
jgi:hypothetical protein